MSARKVSREPYKVRRDRREVWVAVAAALAIVLVTLLAVWILAPADDDSPSIRPTVTVPTSDTTATTLDPTATTAPAADTTATTGGG